ncbi:uncharacterized protein [Physcomitrium patens]|uniref:uncharacterized protein isoform X2 n=1 Tax=Physcomitrium patens TaxID=3218 RepID=UPI000D176ED7|nr:uncharacterized protein LOC112290332 isoform X2 [Physcomitrium patens]XP_024392256.1 uncharacterized protein LOC112290332 isoform X2 [Physcomitrium patens]|eukprot:XP_024392255.1 uncharacterized protein LOC112290332 isoform X2 [Physcomitrella patens]
MPHLLRKNFDENFLSGRIRRGRRNGGETFEEAEEGELDGSVVWAEKPKTGDQEMIWNAKGLDAKTTVKFEKYSIFKDLVYYAFYLLSIPFIVWIGGGVYAPTGRFLVPSKVSLSSLVFAQLALGCCYYAFNGVSLFAPVRGNNLEFQYNIVLLNIIWITRYVLQTQFDHLPIT